MSLAEQIDAFALASGVDLKDYKLSSGYLSDLTVAQKNTFVQALNAIMDEINNLGDIPARVIDDSSSKSDKTYSSEYLETLFSALKGQILDGVDAAFDTLKEISDYLDLNTDQLGALQAATDQKVSYAYVQILNQGEQQQARVNIGLDVGTDLTSLYNAKKSE